MSIKMPTVTANEAKARFGTIIEQAQREPVTITRHGRPSAVMLSAADFALVREMFETLEDQEWLTKANDAESQGFAGIDAGRALLTELRNA